MKHLAIQNFKFGLDSRRDVLTSQPGTLLTLENAVINQGGEVEKRKSFVEFADVSVTYSLGGFTRQATFGLQELSDRLVVFGSAYVSGSHGATRPVITAPTGVTYKQLVHPAVTYGVTYDDTKHRMTAIVCSAQFSDKAWAVATYADGNTFVFYDTDVVLQFLNGKVLMSLTTNLFLAQQLAQQLSGLVDPTTGAGWVVELSDSHVNLVAPASVTFEEAVTEDSVSGSLLVTKVSGPSSGSAGVGATVEFTITTTALGDTITLSAPNGSGGSQALGTATSTNTDNTTFATLVKAAVNAGTATHGYSADNVAGVVTITAPISLGDLVGNLVVTTTGAVTIDGTVPAYLTATLNKTFITGAVAVYAGPTTNVMTYAVTVAVANGTAPYSRVWEVADASFTVVKQDADAQAVRVRKTISWHTEETTQVRCVVTDDAAVVVYTNWIPVALIYDA